LRLSFVLSAHNWDCDILWLVSNCRDYIYSLSTKMSAFSAALDITAGGFTVLLFLDEVYMIYKVIFCFYPLITQMIFIFCRSMVMSNYIYYFSWYLWIKALLQSISIPVAYITSYLPSNVKVTLSFFLAATLTDLAGR
jgi:hypothetical protein